MVELVLPDPKDIREVIADYLDAIVTKKITPNERARIIANCEDAFSLMIRACEIAYAKEIIEQCIYTKFMQDIIQIRRAASADNIYS